MSEQRSEQGLLCEVCDKPTKREYGVCVGCEQELRTALSDTAITRVIYDDTNPPVSQPDGEVPERIFIPLDAARGWSKPTLREDHDIEYIRAPSPDSIAEKAERAANKFSALGSLEEHLMTPRERRRLAAIIAAEFGGESK